MNEEVLPAKPTTKMIHLKHTDADGNVICEFDFEMLILEEGKDNAVHD